MQAIRHNRFYFDDGNAIFRVEDTLFKVHRSILTRNSPIFEDMFCIQSEELEGETDENPILLESTSSLGFASLLACIHPLTVGKLDVMPAEQWVLVLDLASRWQFDAIRDVALKQLNAGLSHGSPTLALQLAAAHRHALDEYYWRVFALLCERSAALYPEEGEILGVCEAVHISAIREKLRGGAKGRAIFESAKRIELTGDQQRMIRSEPQSKPDPGAFTPGQAVWFVRSHT
ncbi:hypothetical protein FOMPIDRAFT_1053109 [Fomitopsis schrenkii]|uniref:BTB domain-containing protein n=1 Tax=Fomitopsis schrenkii TaxID=2126942 RepID=S8FDS0_FOMSC|nr:hypothetical protein FOMPIDRAFT_1053109 [Fomitopsis schrenkii]